MHLLGNSARSISYTYLLLAFSLVVKSDYAENLNSRLDASQYAYRSHQHPYEHFSQRFGIIDTELSGESLAAQTNSTVLPERSDVDIVSFIDNFVHDWTSDPENSPSQAAYSTILATANQVKQAILNPNVDATSGLSANTTASTRKRSSAHFPRAVSNWTFANSTSTNSTLEAARALVRLAQKEANARNVERIKNPRLNNYYTNPTSKAALKARAEAVDLYPINSTIAEAAALVAEADAASSDSALNKDFTIPGFPAESAKLHKRGALEKRAGKFWMENIAHVGRIPFGAGNGNYKVFRNVKDYGAVGDGKTDDTAAINKAMADGNRCGEKCGSSSVKGAVVYFPAGTYLISTPIISYYYTQMVGDVNSFPTLSAAPSFVGLGLISSDVYTGGNGGEEEWYINQSNFFRQIRNFVIDLRSANMIDIAGIHWQVAQATSIQQVFFYQSTAAGKSHMGIFAENGSGGFMSDLWFVGGAIGMRCGNQQFTTRNFIFNGCKTAIDMLWDWGWTWKSLTIAGADYGIKMTGDYMGGSIHVLDSIFKDTKVGIYVSTAKGGTADEQFSVNIDNLVISNVGTTVSDTTSGVTLAGGSQTIDSWTLGKVYDSRNPTGKFQSGGALSSTHPKTASLGGGPHNGYFERSKPQYSDLTANSFLSATLAAKGDGSSDDTFALNLMLALARVLNRPLYIPMGSYMVTNTVSVPVGSRLVGECWAQIVATGANFQDASNPRVMVQVGSTGDSGVIEIQDLLFTNVGPTAGLVMVEWNVAQSSAGSAAMWDSHFRIGGATGTHLQAKDCPKLTGSVDSKCIAASMMLHLTSTSSAYLENVWAWVADHDLDSGLAQTQINIYVARGILIESQGGPTWLYGTASEHAVLYQYQLFNAKNVFMGMVQTESPYYLPTPQAPAPFGSSVGKFASDPTFADCSSSSPHCAAAWGLRIVSSSNVQIAGAGLYNWFQDYIQPCVDTQDCQQRVVQIIGSDSVWIYNLYTIGTVEMINTRSGAPILAKSNTNKKAHPFTSTINAWLIASSSSAGGGTEDDTPVSRAACTGVYNTIDQIVASAANIPSHCIDTYMVGVEVKILQDSLAAYQTTISDGYDDKFKIYANHVKELVPLQINAYMAGAQASGFFTCTTTGRITCCKDCKSAQGCPDNCDRTSNPCTSGIRTTTVNCPTEIPDLADQQTKVTNLAYTCTNTEGFYADISKKYGIDRSWITWGKFLARINGGCWGNPDPNCGADTNTFWTNFPMAGTITVPNPKDLIGGSYDKTKDFANNLAVQKTWMPYELNDAQMSDLVDAASVPALLTATAVDSMSKVVDAANKITAEERKAMILNFIMAVLLLIPGVGEIADEAGMVALRTIISLAGDAGNIALGIFGIVEDPKSAIFALFGFLLGGAGNGKSFIDAAGARRGFSDKDKTTLAPIKGDLDKISNVRSLCTK